MIEYRLVLQNVFSREPVPICDIVKSIAVKSLKHRVGKYAPRYVWQARQGECECAANRCGQKGALRFVLVRFVGAG